MKVKELIKKLEAVDPELEVLVWVNDHMQIASGQYPIEAAQLVTSCDPKDTRFEIDIEIIQK